MAFYQRVGNFAAVTFCSIGAALVGLVLMIAGSITTAYGYLEITPPDYDQNYERYLGSNPLRFLGPVLLGFGLILMIGTCVFFGFAFYVEAKETSVSGPRRYTPEMDPALPEK